MKGLQITNLIIVGLFTLFAWFYFLFVISSFSIFGLIQPILITAYFLTIIIFIYKKREMNKLIKVSFWFNFVPFILLIISIYGMYIKDILIFGVGAGLSQNLMAISFILFLIGYFKLKR